MCFDTPILFIVFNRPRNTEVVFNAIKSIKPSFLYIACDGPRDLVTTDKDNVNEVRSIVSKIDWQCNFFSLFQKNNLGCNIGPKTAIDWFFSNVEEGIILEDDCLPSISFFWFCQKNLRFFRDFDNVMCVTGTNITKNIYFEKDFWFSNYPLMWGWATWRRAWDLYDGSLTDWPKLKKKGWLSSLKMGGWFFRKKWEIIFDETYLLKNNATWWDYQWIFTCFKFKGLTIAPRSNLVKNIGFSQDATHTKKSVRFLSNLTQNELLFDDHCFVSDFNVNFKADKFISRFWFGAHLMGVLKAYIFFFIRYKAKKIFS
jgi:hypothetical protein